MQSRTQAPLVFVSHPVAGVHRIPEAWLDGYAPSGFRLATSAEIDRWHDERGLEPPSDVDVVFANAADAGASGTSSALSSAAA